MANQIQVNSYAHGRGEIKESAVKALVTDRLFHCRVKRKSKGKGSYQRHAKHRKTYGQNETPFKNAQIAYF